MDSHDVHAQPAGDFISGARWRCRTAAGVTRSRSTGTSGLLHPADFSLGVYPWKIDGRFGVCVGDHACAGTRAVGAWCFALAIDWGDLDHLGYAAANHRSLNGAFSANHSFVTCTLKPLASASLGNVRLVFSLVAGLDCTRRVYPGGRNQFVQSTDCQRASCRHARSAGFVPRFTTVRSS